MFLFVRVTQRILDEQLGAAIVVTGRGVVIKSDLRRAYTAKTIGNTKVVRIPCNRTEEVCWFREIRDYTEVVLHVGDIVIWDTEKKGFYQDLEYIKR